MRKFDEEGPLVLLIDKDLAFCQEVEEVFVAQGYEVAVATTLSVAMEVLHRTGRQIIVFVAAEFPFYESLLSYIKKSLFDRTIVFVWTAEEPSLILRDVHEAGGLQVFHKSSSPRLLISWVSKAQELLELIGLSGEDFLTGLDNFRAFSKVALSELRAMYYGHRHEVVSLILIDVDHFKLINERHGYSVANDVLRSIANTLKHHVRPSVDHIARMGGDEFVLLLIDTEEAIAWRRAETLQHEVSNLMLPGKDGEPIKVSISFGIGSIRNQEVGSRPFPETLRLLIEAADIGGLRSLKSMRALSR